MFKICLIQNQSEMVHYRYADLRSFLEKNGFAYDLFTAENIHQLRTHYAENNYDLILFASNVLNDQVIYNEVKSAPFEALLLEHTKAKKGILITHQFNYAKKHDEFTFLPLDPGSLTLQIASGTPLEKSLQMNTYGAEHIIFHYPHKITKEAILETALNSAHIKGVYWHTLHVDTDEFEVLLEDKDPLLVVSPSKNIVIASLLLDWQNHEALLLNILSYLMRKAHPIALVYEAKETSVKHEYVERMLYNAQYELVSYDLHRDHNLLYERLERQLHQIILFPQGMNLKSLYTKNNAFETLVVNNDIRAITLNYEDGTFLLSGSANTLYDIGLALELYIKSELATGYIEGSFWKSMETLLMLRKLNPTFDEIYPKNITSLKETIAPFVTKGSYNDTFHATCALLWFNNVVLQDDDKTAENLKWLDAEVPTLSDYDYLYLAYYKHLAGVTLPSKKDVLTRFTSLRSSNPKDLDLFLLLATAYYYELGDVVIADVITLLKAHYHNYMWLNLFNTTNIAGVLVDMFAEDKLDQESQLMLFDVVIKLRELVYHTPIVKGKFDLVLFIKALTVCSEFEDVLGFPTTELFQVIKPKDEAKLVTKTDLMNAEVMRVHYYQMQNENERNKTKLAKLRWHNNAIVILSYATLVAVYMLVVIAIYLNKKTPEQTLGEFIRATWVYHMGIFPFLVAVVGFFIRFFRKTFGVKAEE